MPLFVVLHHEVGPKFARDVDASAHFDWMFQIDQTLWTWSTDPVDDFVTGIEIDARRIADHRLAYLEITGDIGGDRGTVQPVLRGTYTLVESTDDLFSAVMHWEDESGSHHQAITIERHGADSDRLSESVCRLSLGE